MSVVLIISAVILLVVGLAGTVYPVIPALPLMLAGAWVLAWAQDYAVLGTYSLAVLVVVAVLGGVLDLMAGWLGAKYTGASKQALWGALIGGVAGTFGGMVGLMAGPLVGAAVGEFYAKQNVLRAGKVGLATFIGWIIGTVAKMGAALAMLIVIVWQYVWHGL